MSPEREVARLENLGAYRVLDTRADGRYDRIVALVADLFDAPIVAISLVDEKRQWFRASKGLGVCQTPREWSFCSRAIEQPEPVFIVAHPQSDPRFSDNPLVTGALHIRFYAGARLEDSRGHNLGALCIIDNKERPCLSAVQQQALAEFARLVTQQLELDRTQRELREKERLLSLAEVMSGIGNWRYEVSTGKVTWSVGLYRIFGMEPGEPPLSFEQALEATLPEDRQAVQEAVAKAIACNGEYHLQRRIRIKSGEIRIVQSHAFCESGPEGVVEAIFGVFQDITAQAAATQAKSDFLANMSHELRTPLTGIIGFAELLANQPELSAKSASYLERVVNGSHALLATVNDVLDFSKLEAGQVELRPRPTSARQNFSNVVDLFSLQADAKGIKLELNVSPAVPAIITVDPDRLRQILLNLVGNAVKFTASGGVCISVDYRLPQTLCFTVADTGPGIAAGQVERLFQRFSQVDSSLSRVHGGTGLGLAICKGLIEAMDGTIGVDSTPGQGSTFSVTMPCAAAEGVLQSVQDRSTAISLEAYRILAVDDNPSNRALVAATLKPTGVELTLACGGQEAAEMASRTPFDLILLDLHMPGVNGYAALALIRGTAGPNRGVPILAFTADCASEMRELLEAGFDGVISKPVLPSELVQKITAALSEIPDQSFVIPGKEALHAQS